MAQSGIHPELHDAVVECACGQVIHTRSVLGSFKIDICSACHPVFIGKHRVIDTEGRVQRFNRKYRVKEIGAF